MDERDSLYYLESYVPSYLLRDDGYCEAMRIRLRQMMEAQDYEVRELGQPFKKDTPHIPAQPGMITIRVEVIAREFDSLIPLDAFTEEDAALSRTA